MMTPLTSLSFPSNGESILRLAHRDDFILMFTVTGGIIIIMNKNAYNACVTASNLIILQEACFRSLFYVLLNCMQAFIYMT